MTTMKFLWSLIKNDGLAILISSNISLNENYFKSNLDSRDYWVIIFKSRAIDYSKTVRKTKVYVEKPIGLVKSNLLSLGHKMKILLQNHKEREWEPIYIKQSACNLEINWKLLINPHDNSNRYHNHSNFIDVANDTQLTYLTSMACRWQNWIPTQKVWP